MKKNINANTDKPVKNNAGIQQTPNSPSSNGKEITSEEALKQQSSAFPVVSPYTTVSRAPEQTMQPLIVNNIIMRPVDRTPKDVGRWREDHKMAESIYFPQRSRLYDLYKDVELDGHLSGLMMKRIDTVINKKFRFVDTEGKEIDEIMKLIDTNDFRMMLREIMLSKFWGVSGFEFVPGKDFVFKIIPRKHIKTEKKVIAVNQTDYVGYPYENISNIWVIGEDRDLGILLKASFYVLLKKGSFSDWANYVEIFGQPTIVTKYSQYDEETKRQLTALMNNLGASLKLAIPKEADYDVIDAKSSNGNGDLQKQFVDACNEELSVLVLGNTETTKASKSSGYGQSFTQAKQQFEIAKSDVHFIRNLLNTDKFKVILKSYGYPSDKGSFTVEEEVDVQELLLKSQILTELKNSYNLPIADDDLYEQFNIPKPANYEQLKAQKEAPAIPPPMEENTEGKVNNTGQPPIKPTPSVPNRNPKKQMQNLSAWERFSIYLSNFFDRAPKN